MITPPNWSSTFYNSYHFVFKNKGHTIIYSKLIIIEYLLLFVKDRFLNLKGSREKEREKPWRKRKLKNKKKVFPFRRSYVQTSGSWVFLLYLIGVPWSKQDYFFFFCWWDRLFDIIFITSLSFLFFFLFSWDIYIQDRRNEISIEHSVISVSLYCEGFSSTFYHCIKFLQ